jgi:hypothetical protein
VQIGRVTVTRVPALASTAPATLLVGSAAAFVISYDNVPGYAVPDGGPARILPRAVHPQGQPIPGPDPDHLWVNSANGTRLHLVNLDGASAGPALTLPHDADFNGVLPDGSGYALVETPRGAFDVRPGRTTLVTAGQVLASGPSEWLVGECDKHQRCSAIVVNRRTGARKRIGPYQYSAPPAPGVVSADGKHAAVLALSGEGAGAVDLIDLATGRGRLLNIFADAYAADAMVFSPDGKWLLVADGGVVPVNVATGTTVPFDNPWGPVAQLAVRSG